VPINSELDLDKSIIYKSRKNLHNTT